MMHFVIGALLLASLLIALGWWGEDLGIISAATGNFTHPVALIGAGLVLLGLDVVVFVIWAATDHFWG